MASGDLWNLDFSECDVNSNPVEPIKIAPPIKPDNFKITQTHDINAKMLGSFKNFLDNNDSFLDEIKDKEEEDSDDDWDDDDSNFTFKDYSKKNEEDDNNNNEKEVEEKGEEKK
eukprot:TRINITY_DN1149_c4_g1_i1.p1 TRINITY_DN1149_c4_g1~~TRINITY_DN1149_c4_g1_i1.p1  ORF type:complete len:114 (-),score=57.00 TRINITY_DN1149_c4_g1_i1:156-497(-)